MKQKLLASAMALAMVLSLTPVTALAAEEDTALPEEEITVQTETTAEDPVQPETETEDAPAEESPEAEVEEPAEPEIPAEELVPADEIPVEEPAEPESAAEETDSAEPVQPETVEEPVEVETTVPTISSIEISDIDAPEVVNGSYIFTAPLDSAVNSYTVTVTLSDGAVFTPTTPTTPNTGDLYVEEVGEGTATLKFNLNVGGVDISADQFALVLEETGDNVWTGGFENAVGLSLETLAGYLVDQDIQLAAGALGTGSEAQQILVNQDAEDVMLALCAPNATVYTVDYVVDEDTTITWKLPAGMTLPNISVEMTAGSTFEGWYTDEDYTTALSGTVSGDMTIYGKVTTQSVSGDFLSQLGSGEDVTIDSMVDWNVFVQNSDLAKAGQVVTLGMNIDCDNATYDSMTFAGSFNGAGFTISDATFRAVSTSSGDTCSGMFAKIGPGQTVANLTLQNVTAQYSGTYAGVLAGMVDGAGGGRALVQNVQVRNSSSSGRSAGGVAGFIRNADVRYCSSRDTTITGLANGGGIVGLNNAKVQYCYSTCTPTALPSLFGGNAGGVVGKNVRGAYTEYCWATMKVVGGSGTGSEAGGTDIGPLEVNEDMWEDDFESFPPCDFWWKLSEDGSTQRKPKSCGILRILASVFRFYLNPPGFPSSSHFCPEL